MQVVPLNTVASQLVSIVLGGQNCQISVYTKDTGTFVDLLSNGKAIVLTRLAVDRIYLVQGGYQGFVGNLVFVDTQANANPDHAQYGTRFFLCYLEAADL